MVPPDGRQRPPPSPPPPYAAQDMSRLPMSASAPPLYYGATDAPYSALPPYDSSRGGGASKSFSAKAPFNTSREPLIPPQPGQTTIIVDATLRPGTCVVCRKGQMKESATQWTWLACLLLVPFGILPGIVAYCCCFRRPKCTSCGYAV